MSNQINIIPAEVNILTPLTPERCREMLLICEYAGRTCYQSTPKGDPEKFISGIVGRGHESVIEHQTMTVEFITDRACYDDQTMVLTDSGWKYFKDVDIESDLICTKNEDGFVYYTKAVDKIDHLYSGYLDIYNSTQINLAVTPDHMMWLYDHEKRSSKTKTWKFIKSSDVTNSRYCFDKSSRGLMDSRLHTITIPDVKRHTGFMKRIYKGFTFTGIQLNNFMELLGLWITDGCLSFGKGTHGNQISITQIKPNVRTRIFELLNALNIKYSINSKDIRLNSPALFDWLVDNFIDGVNTRKTYYLKLPRWVFNLSRLNMDCLLRGIFLGDGSPFTRKINDKRHVGLGIQIYTASEHFARDLVELAMLTGRCGNIRKIPRRIRTFPNGTTSMCQEQYVVSIHGTTVTLFNNNDKHRYSMNYNGHVYCLSLPSDHKLYVMRNGKACWCGNCSHELVRHRIAAYSQESTRYVNYKNGVEFIKMIEFQYHNHLSSGDVNHLRDVESLWEMSCQQSADAYHEMVDSMNCRPETARSVLNNSLKTSIIATFNLREWRHVFVMRCGKPAHPHIKEIMIPLLMYFKQKFPGMFDNIPYDEEFYAKYRFYLDSHIHEKWSEIIPPYHDVNVEEPSPIIQALAKEENAVVEPEVDHKPIVIDSESETTRPIYTETSEPIEPMDYDEEVTLSEVINKDASSNPTEGEKCILERLKEKGAIIENTEVKYLVEADLNGMYKYSPNGDKPMLKELAECTTKVRCRKILNLKSIGIVPYANVGDQIHMMTTMVVDQNLGHSDILNIAKEKFVEILATQNKGEFIPYVMKITIQQK